MRLTSFSKTKIQEPFLNGPVDTLNLLTWVYPMWLKIQVDMQFHTMVLVSKSEDSASKLLADLQAQLAYNLLYIEIWKTNKNW